MRGKKREGERKRAWRVGHGWWTAAGVCGGRFVWTCPQNPHTSPFPLGPPFVRSFVRSSVRSFIRSFVRSFVRPSIRSSPLWPRHSTRIKARLRPTHARARTIQSVCSIEEVENPSTWRKVETRAPTRVIERMKRFRSRGSEYSTIRKQTSLGQPDLTKKRFKIY